MRGHHAVTAIHPSAELTVPPAGGFWQGRWQDGADVLQVSDPEDGCVVGWVSDASEDEARAAVDYLVHGWARTPWPQWQRREALQRAAERVAQLTGELSSLISREGCKTISEARAEVERAAETLRLSAQAGDGLSGRTVPFDDTPRGAGWQGWYTREPLGVVAAITPFNDPLNLVAHKLGPALIAGNAVVLKPADATPLTALALVRILLEAGVPPQYLAAVCGHRAGPALVRHPGVDVVSFTGGAETADRIAAAGPARKLMMELGGNNALVVCADSDAQKVCEAVVDGAFGAAGQNCLSVQRVYVHASLFQEVLDGVLARTAGLRVGSKQDLETDVGPLITEQEAERVETWVGDAVAAGATLHIGGRRRGSFVSPAVLTDVPPGARLSAEEVFGPVVCLQPFETLDEAVAAANAVDTGLQAGVFSRDVGVALDVASRLRVGAVMVNASSDFRVDAMPFGGFKRSGVGREGVEHAVLELTAPKMVALNLAGSGMTTVMGKSG